MAVNDPNKNGKITINDTEITVYDDSEIKNEIDQLQTYGIELYQLKHTHENKSVLDKLQQTGSEETIDLSEITAHETAIDQLASQSHTHPNKSSLDRIGITQTNKLTIDGEEQNSTEYTHPETHPATMITEDETHRFVTDFEKANWNSKAEKTHTHNLSSLLDVEITPSQLKGGDVLVFFSGKWKPSTLPTGGTTTSVHLEEYRVDESIEYLIPLDVVELQTTDITKTSITLTWKPNPRTTGQIEYQIHAGNTLVGTTNDTTFEITSLTSSTPYTLTVKTKAGNHISNGRSVITQTQGNFVLSLRGGSEYVETSTLTFDAMEIICSLTPKVGSWTNFLIDGKTTTIQIYTQHNGASYRRSGCDLYVNGKFEPSTSYGIIPSVQKVTVRIEGTDEKKILDSFHLFANDANTTTMQAQLFRVRLFTRNGQGELIIKSDYDFTNKPAANAVTDILNNSPDLVIHGGLFIGN